MRGGHSVWRVGSVLYGVLAAADTLAAGVGLPRVVKPLLMPALAAALPRRAAVDVALAGSCLGDLALLGEGDLALAGGIGGFACAHVAYLYCLRAVGRTPGASPRVVAERISAAGFALVAAGAGAAILPGLRERRELRLPVLGYAALVTAMGHSAVRAGLRTGDRRLLAGGALFVVSDGLVAASLFGERTGGRSGAGRADAVLDAAVMATYTAAQALLAGALALRPSPTPR